jgi:hypothetical protein
VIAAAEGSLRAEVVVLEATGTSAGVSASCENGNVVMPWIGPRESDGLPAYGR